MNLKEEHVSVLHSLVDVIARIRGVIAIFLFGSVARGDYDEYSDYDLLVVFQDKTVMWAEWDGLFVAVSRLQVSAHVIPEALDELHLANPVFLEELQRRGRILFARFPFEMSARPLKLEPFTLIFYDMGGLGYREKMRISYLLYRKGGDGIVAQSGGSKLGEGCILVPKGAGEEIARRLGSSEAHLRRLDVFVDKEVMGSWAGRRPKTSSVRVSVPRRLHRFP